MGLIVNKQKNKMDLEMSYRHLNPWSKSLEFYWKLLNSYDACIFHMPEFVYEKIEIPTYTILPSIDPLHPKNIDLSEEEIKKL